jgi:hypothetical protein
MLREVNDSAAAAPELIIPLASTDGTSGFARTSEASRRKQNEAGELLRQPRSGADDRAAQPLAL